MKMNNVNLGQIVFDLVEEKGLSHSQFAARIGLKRQNVKKQVYMKRSLDTDLVCRINEALDCNLFDYYKCDTKDYNPLKATVKIEMGEQTQEKTFTFLFGNNELKIK